jgi:outer membrane protein assembly factor BamB
MLPSLLKDGTLLARIGAGRVQPTPSLVRLSTRGELIWCHPVPESSWAILSGTGQIFVATDRRIFVSDGQATNGVPRSYRAAWIP